MKTKIPLIGEIIRDIFPRKQFIGGTPLNLAEHTCFCGGTLQSHSRSGDSFAAAWLTSYPDGQPIEDYIKKQQRSAV